jgi:hypothetical protein
MISRICPALAAAFLAASCGSVGDYKVGYDYRIASKDPKVTSAQMLTVVTQALERPEASASYYATAWAQVDEKTGEVTFTLSSFGSGKTTGILNTESRVVSDLRRAFGDRVEVFCNGDRLRADGSVEPRIASPAPPPAQQGTVLGP